MIVIFVVPLIGLCHLMKNWALRMRRTTWPVGTGSKTIAYLEFTMQLLWGSDND